MYGTYKELAF